MVGLCVGGRGGGDFMALSIKGGGIIPALSMGGFLGVWDLVAIMSYNNSLSIYISWIYYLYIIYTYIDIYIIYTSLNAIFIVYIHKYIFIFSWSCYS